MRPSQFVVRSVTRLCIDSTLPELAFTAIIVPLELEDGEVVEGWSNIDVMGMMTQLGVVDPP